MVDRNAQALADQLLALPSPDRARLAELLLASLEERDTGASVSGLGEWEGVRHSRRGGLRGS